MAFASNGDDGRNWFPIIRFDSVTKNCFADVEPPWAYLRHTWVMTSHDNSTSTAAGACVLMIWSSYLFGEGRAGVPAWIIITLLSLWCGWGLVRKMSVGVVAFALMAVTGLLVSKTDNDGIPIMFIILSCVAIVRWLNRHERRNLRIAKRQRPHTHE